MSADQWELDLDISAEEEAQILADAIEAAGLLDEANRLWLMEE